MLSALQQLYRAIINAPAPGSSGTPGSFGPPGSSASSVDGAPIDIDRDCDDRLQFKTPLTAHMNAGRLSFQADARTFTTTVLHGGIIRPCQMHLVGLHGDGETFSIRLVDHLGGCVQLAAHVVERRNVARGKRTTITCTFQGLTDHLDEAHPQLSHSGSTSGRLELRGRIDDPASWTCRLTADYHAAPQHNAAPVDIRTDKPQHAA